VKRTILVLICFLALSGLCLAADADHPRGHRGGAVAGDIHPPVDNRSGVSNEVNLDVPVPEKTVPKEKLKQIIHLKYAKAKDMAIMLQVMLPDISVYALEELNALEIYDTAEMINEAQSLINLSDLPKRQVVIELNAFEISQTWSSDVGWEVTNWTLKLESVLPPHKLFKDSLAGLFPGTISFQDARTEVKLLASPKIMITNRQQAVIHIGERIPYETENFTNGKSTYTVEFVDVGIMLTVTPTIYINDEIDITLSAEVSSVGKYTANGNPEIGTRKTDTSIHLKNGYTAVLGGLTNHERRETFVGIPILSRIPFLGYLFGRTKYENVVTEVRISLTPQIVSTVGIADAGSSLSVPSAGTTLSPAPAPENIQPQQ